MRVKTNQTGRVFAEMALGRALGLLGHNSDRNAKLVLGAIDLIARGEKQRIMREWAHDWLGEGKPGREFLGKILGNIHPNVRRRYIARMIVSLFFRERPESMLMSPLISPTMRCNYRCQGCFAASYDRKDDMSPEVFDRVLREGEALGINFFLLVGGEPMLYPGLLDILGRHDRSFFQIYTNGSLIDPAMAERLAKIGNIAPQISVNGPARYTDSSRGAGAFQQVMQAMDNLREAGCVFGFSTLVTRDNADAICSEEWFDLLVDKGALYGWLFLYMPVGGDPNPALMPTPDQRNNLRLALRLYRKTKPILPVDFWNDGTLTGGCIAGGRAFFHINHRGYVEPCIFCHFATNNINDCTLAEALDSPFFKAIRESQPFSYNTLRPCPMIDHPQTMWRIINQAGARPTHEGAEKMFTTFAGDLEKYAAGAREILDNAWDNEGYQQWAPQWAAMCGVPDSRLEVLRKTYTASRGIPPCPQA